MILPKYEAKTKLFIGKQESQMLNQSYDNNDVQMYQKLLKTYAEVISTRDLVERAIDDQNLDLKSSQVLKELTVNPRADTQILEIGYTNIDANVAKEIVESITDEFIEYSTELIPNGNVRIIEEVKVPEQHISPNKKLNIIIAFLLGLVISIGLGFLIEFVDNTFQTKEQIEDILGLPAIGVIPNQIEL